MARAFVGLGSNLGDRVQHLVDAVAGLTDVVAVSGLYETDPVGGPPGQGPYLNAVVELDTARSARELLEVAQRLERAAGRERVEHWGPRTLDVDVLWIEGVEVDDDDLLVPHPRLWERTFVLVPLHDLAPDLVGDRPADEGVRYFWDPLHPQAVGTLLAGLDAPWRVAGGWAIDLFLGQVTRAHGDVDVELARPDAVAAARHLEAVGWEVWTAGRGALSRWRPHDPLPAHVTGLWCRPAGPRPWGLDLMLNAGDRGTWMARRVPELRVAAADATAEIDGLPVLRPEFQLLMKARGATRRPKDDLDFAAVVPRLDREAFDRLRGWLADFLPDHPWTGRLEQSRPLA